LYKNYQAHSSNF